VARTPAMSAALSASRDGSFWRLLTDRERAALVEVGRQRSYRKGATVIRAADPARWAVVLLSGRVRLTAAGNGAHVVAMRQTGDIVGEQRVVDGQPQQATVRAETTVQALVLDGADLDRLIGQLPHVLWVLCAVLSERLRECYARIATQSSDAFTRIVRFLAEAATGDRPFTVHIGSQEALGEELSVSRDSVVRALRRLRADDVVTTHRGLVTVRDPRRLRAYLNR
jgi:CRP/FNR family transcriptional regulator, cyclic AMP receptor protein